MEEVVLDMTSHCKRSVRHPAIAEGLRCADVSSSAVSLHDRCHQAAQPHGEAPAPRPVLARGRVDDVAGMPKSSTELSILVGILQTIDEGETLEKAVS
jgi:hypothetical protein